MGSDFVRVAFVNFLVYFVFYLLISTIAPYASQVLRTSSGLSGLSSGIFVIGILFGRLIAGGMSNRVPAKTTLVIGNMCFTCCSFLYPWARDVASLVFLRFLHGLSFGIAHNACGTIAASMLPPSRRGEGIAYYSFGQIISAALGPFMGIRFVNTGNFGPMFLLGSAVSASALLLSLSVPDTKAALREGKATGSSLLRFIEPRAMAVSLVIMVAGLAFSSVLAFLSMYGVEFGLLEPSRYFFLVYAASVLATRPLSGRLLDLFGAQRVLPPCLILFATGLFLLAKAGSGIWVLLSGFLIGLGYGNVLSLGQAEAVKVVPQDRIAVATATYFIFLDIGAGFGPYVFGSLIPHLGYRSLYTLMGIITLLALPVYHALSGRSAVSSVK